MQKFIILILFTLVSLTWGTTWLAMKISIETVPPIFATGMRFLSSAPFLIVLALAFKAPLLYPRGQRSFQLIVGIFYFAIPFTLMIYGETYVNSGLASVIFSSMPVAVLIVSSLTQNIKVSLMQAIGLCLSVAALAGVLLIESKESGSNSWRGILSIMLAVVIHAVMYVQCKIKCCKVSVLTFNAFPCLSAGLSLLVVGWLYEHPDVRSFSTHSILAIAYLGVFAGVFGILCYFLLQKKATSFQASIVFLIFPVIAVILEQCVYGGTFSTEAMLLLAPLALGIFITLTFQ